VIKQIKQLARQLYAASTVLLAGHHEPYLPAGLMRMEPFMWTVLARGLFDLANRVGTLNEGHFLLPLLTTVGN
jgi:hypothetical protein